MMGVTHATSGAAAWIAITSTLPLVSSGAYPLDPVGVLAGTAVCAGAALLPDADHHSATIAHSVPIVGRLANDLVVAESLLALREGRADEAAERLGEAAAEERRLGFAFDGACIALDQARALEAAGQAEEAVRVRSGAEELMWALDCVNPF